MSNIIFNEQKVLDDIFKNNKCDLDIYKTIQILIKYYYLEEGNNRLSIREKTIETISNINEEFKRNDWVSSIDKAIEKMLKGIRVFGTNPKILNINKVDIYKEELDYIDSFKYVQQRKILFVLLVYSKIYNQMLDSDEGWITENFSDILKISKSKTGNNQYRLDILRELKDSGAINVFFKNGNSHIKVNYLKHEGNKILEVTDFENIIYYYLIYKGEKWKQCEVCGKYFKINSKTYAPKYCNKCAKELKQKQTNECKNRKK